MATDFEREIREQLRDLGIALLILIKEAVFAFSVFAVGNLLGWSIRSLSQEADRVSGVLKIISDLGAVILFVVLVTKDLWDYFKRR